jgi:hypothetical protein
MAIYPIKNWNERRQDANESLTNLLSQILPQSGLSEGGSSLPQAIADILSGGSNTTNPNEAAAESITASLVPNNINIPPRQPMPSNYADRLNRLVNDQSYLPQRPLSFPSRQSEIVPPVKDSMPGLKPENIENFNYWQNNPTLEEAILKDIIKPEMVDNTYGTIANIPIVDLPQTSPLTESMVKQQLALPAPAERLALPSTPERLALPESTHIIENPYMDVAKRNPDFKGITSNMEGLQAWQDLLNTDYLQRRKVYGPPTTGNAEQNLLEMIRKMSEK